MLKFGHLLFVQMICSLLLGLTIDAAVIGDANINLRKGQNIVVKIPQKLLRFENRSISTGLPIYTCQISTSSIQNQLRVGTISDWQMEGWPLMLDLTYEKTARKKEYTEIEFRGMSAYVKLRFNPNIQDVHTALNRVIYLGHVNSFETTSEFKELADVLLPKSFPGALGDIPRYKQLQLLKELGYNDEAVSIEEFKGQKYIAFTGFDPTSEFNSLKVNQTARAATVLKAVVLPAFNKIAPLISEAGRIDGIKIKQRIFYRDFLSERYDPSHIEVLEIFAPYELVEKYFNRDISNQKLIDGSYVLLNGDRIEVDLTMAARI